MTRKQGIVGVTALLGLSVIVGLETAHRRGEAAVVPGLFSIAGGYLIHRRTQSVGATMTGMAAGGLLGRALGLLVEED